MNGEFVAVLARTLTGKTARSGASRGCSPGGICDVLDPVYLHADFYALTIAEHVLPRLRDARAAKSVDDIELETLRGR
jgi:hypothetical protein